MTAKEAEPIRDYGNTDRISVVSAFMLLVGEGETPNTELETASALADQLGKAVGSVNSGAESAHVAGEINGVPYSFFISNKTEE